MHSLLPNMNKNIHLRVIALKYYRVIDHRKLDPYICLPPCQMQESRKTFEFSSTLDAHGLYDFH